MVNTVVTLIASRSLTESVFLQLTKATHFETVNDDNCG